MGTAARQPSRGLMHTDNRGVDHLDSGIMGGTDRGSIWLVTSVDTGAESAPAIMVQVDVNQAK
jgi:hypothetical protein